MAEGQETGASQAALDPAAVEALRELTGGDEEALREVATAFLEDAPDQLGEITDGLASGDSPLVRRAAHTLKGNAHTFGAVGLGDACRRLEEAARDGTLDDAGALAAEIEREWALARPEIASLAG